MICFKSNFIKIAMFSIVCITHLSAAPSAKNLQNCKDDMFSYFGYNNLHNSVKYAIKHYLLIDFKSKYIYAKSYYNDFVIMNLVLSDGIPLPPVFCGQQFQGNIGRIQDCISNLTILFGAIESDILYEALYNKKQRPIIFNTNNNSLLYICIFPEESYVYNYLDEIANNVTVDETKPITRMYLTPESYCDNFFDRDFQTIRKAYHPNNYTLLQVAITSLDMICFKSNFITVLMISVVCITLTSSMDPEPPDLVRCKDGMRYYFQSLNNSLLNCAKHAVKNLLWSDFTARFKSARKYYRKFERIGLVKPDNIRLPMTFCNELAEADEDEFLNCSVRLVSVFGNEQNTILRRALYRHKQGPPVADNIDVNQPENENVHPPHSYAYKYLNDIAKHIFVDENIEMYQTPLNYCNHYFNPEF